MDLKEESLLVHKKNKGKLQIISKIPVKNRHDLSVAYTPGVAEPCLEIAKDKNKIYDYTIKGSTVAIVTNGTAVLGLGDIGAGAGLPVMEGKAILFKEFSGLDPFPICIDSKDPEEIIRTVKLIAPVFGGINLEDIKAPECFYIEETLKKEMDIPVFHDDQHGTAVVVLAGLTNALRIVNKNKASVKVVLCGAGSAGIAITKLLLKAGVANITLCDYKGAIVEGDINLNKAQEEISKVTNRDFEKGTLKDIIKDKDVFIGVSAPGIVTSDMIKTMNKDSIVFSLANPVPEIMPKEAIKGGARVVASGRSDYPNQVNNVLVFPGIFKGALEVRSKVINDEMKLAAAYAIADLIDSKDLKEDYIIPDVFDKRVCNAVSTEVKRVAIEMGLSRI
jgi:malate dehydrogenase (oxaloacetate-decarboxylating)